MLKKLRVLFAVVMGAVITFYFLDFAGLTTGWPNLARIQFVPALLAGSFGIVLILLVATLLFGRIYCSVICPMGIFQDVRLAEHDAAFSTQTSWRSMSSSG